MFGDDSLFIKMVACDAPDAAGERESVGEHADHSLVLVPGVLPWGG